MQLLIASLIGLTCLLVGPVLLLFVQVLAARLPSRRQAEAAPRRPRLAVLVPAHNEEQGLGATVIALRAQMEAGDRLLMIADNCTDDTAGVAASHQAEVVVRNDPVRRGKGYALDHGMRQLALDPPELVVIVDADCELHPGGLNALALRCAASGRPVQALYLMHAPPGASLRTRVGEFAWIVKNRVRPLGYHRLGLPCQLMGTGMAFPWALLLNSPLASGSIVEDLQLGLALAGAGAAPLFCPEARVTSAFPNNEEGLRAQRTRWEHGHIATLLAQGPRLLWLGLRRGRPELVAMALDLCVPPLASLTLALCALVGAGALLGATTGHWGAAALASTATCVLGVSVLMAWQQHGQGAVTLRELLSAPWYVLGKLPVYARLLMQRQTNWVRTKRDDHAP